MNMKPCGTSSSGKTVISISHDHTGDLYAMGEKHLKRLNSKMTRSGKRNPQDHCPQAEKASLKTRSPGAPFSIDRMARLPLP